MALARVPAVHGHLHEARLAWRVHGACITLGFHGTLQACSMVRFAGLQHVLLRRLAALSRVLPLSFMTTSPAAAALAAITIGAVACFTHALCCSCLHTC
eukprot:38478-Chlamydomonas_euryale.AAC.4